MQGMQELERRLHHMLYRLGCGTGFRQAIDMVVQQFGDEEKVLHQPEFRAAVTVADEAGYPGTTLGCFAGIDQLFDGPVVHPIALGVAAVHAPSFLQ